VKNLRNEYSEFQQVNGNTKVGTLKKEFGVTSLNAVRKALRRNVVLGYLAASLFSSCRTGSGMAPFVNDSDLICKRLAG
jgi:hypothetical protein